MNGQAALIVKWSRFYKSEKASRNTIYAVMYAKTDSIAETVVESIVSLTEAIFTTIGRL